MPVCGHERTRGRGLCQRDVDKEGDRCSQHSEEALRRKKSLDDEKKLASESQQESGIIEVDASSIEEFAKKLNPQMEVVRKLERILRDPEDDEGEDVYIALSRQNLVRLQMRVENNPNYIPAIVAVGNAIGQLKMNEKRQTEIEIRKMELSRLRREAQSVSAASADVLSYMGVVDRALESSFFEEDPSPRRSVDAYAAWLGEDITVDQVLAGEAEYATAPWEMQREILQALFWPSKSPSASPTADTSSA